MPERRRAARSLAICCSSKIISVPLPLVSLSPKLGVVTHVGKLGADLDIVAVRCDAAADQSRNAKLAAGLLEVDIFAFVVEDGVARLYFETGNVGEAGDEGFGDAVAQIVGVWIAAYVGEGQDGHGIDLRFRCAYTRRRRRLARSRPRRGAAIQMPRGLAFF